MLIKVFDRWISRDLLENKLYSVEEAPGGTELRAEGFYTKFEDRALDEVAEEINLLLIR